jgi:hypothetical protein
MKELQRALTGRNEDCTVDAHPQGGRRERENGDGSAEQGEEGENT